MIEPVYPIPHSAAGRTVTQQKNGGAWTSYTTGGGCRFIGDNHTPLNLFDYKRKRC